MSVYQLKDGRWVVQYREDGGKHRREYFGRTSADEEKAKLRDLEVKQQKVEERYNPTPESPTFTEIANAYLTAKAATASTNSIRLLINRLRGQLLPLLGTTEVLRISLGTLDRYVIDRRATGVKSTTVHRELSDVLAILNWAVSRGLIHHNPVSGYRKPKRDDEIIQPASLEECRAIIAHSPPHVARALTISFYTGLRPGVAELFGLKWHAVNWDASTIHIVSAQKGGRKGREIPLHPDFLAQLRKWYKEDQEVAGEYIIRYWGKPVKSIKRAFNAAKEKAGITRRLTPYALRHTFVTSLLDSGADLKSVSELAGHASAEITMRIYQHTSRALHHRTITNHLPSLKQLEQQEKIGTTNVVPGKINK